MNDTSERSDVIDHPSPKPHHGTSRTWQRTIAGRRYSFNAVLMPSGERRYFARQLEAGRDDHAALFSCYWHPVLSWTFPAIKEA